MVPVTALRRHREASGLSQADFARRIPVKAPVYNMVENGRQLAWPKLRRRCSELLGVDETILFPEERVVRVRVETLEADTMRAEP